MSTLSCPHQPSATPPDLCLWRFSRSPPIPLFLPLFLLPLFFPPLSSFPKNPPFSCVPEAGWLRFCLFGLQRCFRLHVLSDVLARLPGCLSSWRSGAGRSRALPQHGHSGESVFPSSPLHRHGVRTW